MVVVVAEKDLTYAIDILHKYGVTTPVYSSMEYKGEVYYVFEKGPAAALMLIDLNKGVHLYATN